VHNVHDKLPSRFDANMETSVYEDLLHYIRDHAQIPRECVQGFEKEPEKAESFTVLCSMLLYKEQGVVQKDVTDVDAF